jgi:diacylglycerol kinase family enzyme
MASRHIALILNPLSGSGMQQPTVRRAAWARQIDVREVRAGYRAEALARDAVDKGAQVLTAAGGDGTVSAVAGLAVEHDVPLVVVPCGTRNHFAKDCGTDITDPAGELAAMRTVSSSGRCRDGQRPGVFGQRLGRLLCRDGA